MNRTMRIISGIVVLLLVAGGSFFGGTLYGKAQAQTALAARRQGAFPGAGQGTDSSRANPVRTDGPAHREAGSSAKLRASLTAPLSSRTTTASRLR